MSTTATVPASTLLALNAGSSSLKFAIFDGQEIPRAVLRGEVQSIGSATAHIVLDQDSKRTNSPISPSYESAITAVLGAIGHFPGCMGIGHRIVHPGIHLDDHQIVTPQVRAQLNAAIELDRAHLPLALKVLDRFQAAFPSIPHVACLDTVFHRHMPRVSQLLPIPRHWIDSGIRRLGFHGLSYAYLLQELERIDGPAVAAGRVVFAHLGSGASMAGVRGRRCLDTTMGFTATAGLMMATRPGDLDPGAVAYLAQQLGLDGLALERMLVSECGLTGVSGGISDMRTLQKSRDAKVACAEAIDLFCHQARRWLGSLVVIMGGVDTIVFSGGIGEHSAEIRGAIMDELDFIGVRIDPQANVSHQTRISSENSRVLVRIIPTDEEAMMAQIVRRLCPAA